MAWLPLVLAPVVFVIVAMAKPRLAGTPLRNICAACAGFALSWVVLLALRWTGAAQVDVLPIGILLGMSVTGLSYALERAFTAARLRHFWAVRMDVLLGGYAAVILLLTNRVGAAAAVAIFAALLAVIVAFLLQGTTHEDAVQAAGRNKNDILSKLDNCC